jgi:hypothetical protein
MKKRSPRLAPRKQAKPPERKPKRTYRVKNWATYDKALVQRGAVMRWISQEGRDSWLYSGKRGRGAPFVYSDAAIQVMLVLRAVYHLTNRGVEGFVRLLFRGLGFSLPVPDHSTLSRRGKTLSVRIDKRGQGPLHMVIDSSGLKVYGEWE